MKAEKQLSFCDTGVLNTTKLTGADVAVWLVVVGRGGDGVYCNVDEGWLAVLWSLSFVAKDISVGL